MFCSAGECCEDDHRPHGRVEVGNLSGAAAQGLGMVLVTMWRPSLLQANTKHNHSLTFTSSHSYKNEISLF